MGSAKLVGELFLSFLPLLLELIFKDTLKTTGGKFLQVWVAFVRE